VILHVASCPFDGSPIVGLMRLFLALIALFFAALAVWLVVFQLLYAD
jgi:hypothetical protein